MTTPAPTQPAHKFMHYLNLTLLAVYFHALMEWLFFVTQSSSLSPLSWFEKAKVLFVTGGTLAVMLIALYLVFALPAQKWSVLAAIPAALMLSITALLMLDNFTYTVFKIGVVTATGAWRILYIAVFVAIFYWMLGFVRRQRLWKRASLLTFSLLAISAAGILSIYLSRDPALRRFNVIPLEPSASRPNIVIIGGDGLSAAYLSAYGFTEETTPFLEELIQTSLVAENAFPNASSTTGSTASMLTGREPASVRVYRYPDILSDEDSFKHLPGILRNMGYYTVEIGTKTYVDARKINLAEGFDVINGDPVVSIPWLSALQPILGNSPSAYFIQITVERIQQRLSHIFFIRDMDDPFKQVNNPFARITDEEREQQIIDLLEESDQPVFIFAHFMNTHGPHFGSDDKSVSAESPSKEDEWNVELYKESILSFDGHIRDIYTYLEESGKLDNTILIVYTDHGYRYVVNQRIPLIMHFPQDEYAGNIQNNVQIIDVPATLLDHMDVDQPQWMTGSSLLSGEPPAQRQIISITGGSPKKIQPPFFQIKSIQVLVCQRWYVLNVQDVKWKTGDVKGHTAPCDPALLPPDAQIQQVMLDYLEHYGYDTNALEESLKP